MIGFLLSMVVNPHILEASKPVQLHDGVVSVCLINETNIDVELNGPRMIALPTGEVEVTGIRFRADDAPALVRAAREYL